jgi:hypothetical protein
MGQVSFPVRASDRAVEIEAEDVAPSLQQRRASRSFERAGPARVLHGALARADA